MPDTVRPMRGIPSFVLRASVVHFYRVGSFVAAARVLTICHSYSSFDAPHFCKFLGLYNMRGVNIRLAECNSAIVSKTDLGHIKASEVRFADTKITTVDVVLTRSITSPSSITFNSTGAGASVDLRKVRLGFPQNCSSRVFAGVLRSNHGRFVISYDGMWIPERIK